MFSSGGPSGSQIFLRSLQTMYDPQNLLSFPPPDRVKNDRSLKGSTMIDLDNGRKLMLLDVTVCPLIHFITKDKQPRRIRVKSKAMRNPYQDETKRMLPRIHQSRDIGWQESNCGGVLCVSINKALLHRSSSTTFFSKCSLHIECKNNLWSVIIYRRGGGGSEYSGYVTKIFIIPLYGSVVL